MYIAFFDLHRDPFPPRPVSGDALAERRLSPEETQAYIERRLSEAGASDPLRLFPASACRAVHEATGGRSSGIDAMAGQALLAAYREGVPSVSVHHVGLRPRPIPLPPSSLRPSAPGPAPAPPPREVAEAVPVPVPVAVPVPRRGRARSLVFSLAALGLLASLVLTLRVWRSGRPEERELAPPSLALAAASRDTSPPPTAPPPSADPRVTIQFASFRTRTRAEAVLDEIMQRTGQPGFLITGGTDTSAVWYGVLLGAFATEDEARAAATPLVRDGTLPEVILRPLPPDWRARLRNARP